MAQKRKTTHTAGAIITTTYLYSGDYNPCRMLVKVKPAQKNRLKLQFVIHGAFFVGNP